MNFVAILPSEPECRVDQDCPYPLACISNRCQSVCAQRPCRGDLICTVEHGQGGSNVAACACPTGLILHQNGQCLEGIPPLILFAYIVTHDNLKTFICSPTPSWLQEA